MTQSGHEWALLLRRTALTCYTYLSSSGLGVTPMRRREFLTLIGCAAATWPVVGHAQQQITPLVAVLCTGTAEALERYLASFREGMHELGYVEGSNIRFEFRFA